MNIHLRNFSKVFRHFSLTCATICLRRIVWRSEKVRKMGFFDIFLSLVPRFACGESSGARKKSEKWDFSTFFSRLCHDLGQPTSTFASVNMKFN